MDATLRKLTLAAALAIVTLGAGGQGVEPAEIKMIAEKYDFQPDIIKLKKGDHVRLLITAVDHDHGIKIEAFHINQKLPKGEPVSVEFTADRAGTFPFECSQFCGLGHKKMKGRLVVE